MPSEGSSSRSSLGLAISARPITSICCSPPLIVPADLGVALLEPRKAGQDHLEGARDAGLVGAGEGAHQQIVLHRH